MTMQRVLETKNRLNKLVRIIVELSLLLFGYLLVYLFIPFFRLPCVFNLITGLNCPGCGISRMLVSFSQLEFLEGIKYNYFLAFTFPVVVIFIIYGGYFYVTNKKNKALEISLVIYLILFILWGIVRNIIHI